MDVERTIEFILQQQASLTAQMGELQARMGEMQSLVGRLATQQLELTQHVDHFQREVSAAVLTIADAQRRTEERLANLAERQAHLAEAQAHTEERLNALIAIVDGIVRHIKPQ